MLEEKLLEVLREDKLRIFADTAYRAPDTLDSFRQRVSVCLRALAGVHPQFGDLVVVHGDEESVIPSDHAGLGELIANAVFDPERPDDYLETAADGSLLPRSRHRFGFAANFRSRAHETTKSGEGWLFKFTFCGNSEGNAGGSRTVLEFALLPGCAWTDPALLRSIIQVMVEHWEADYANVVRLGFQRRLWREFGKSAVISWMTYYPRRSLVACLPSDIPCEPIGDGALLVTSAHMPDPENAFDLEQARRVRGALAELGLADEPMFWVLHGWPPDDEEARYEQAISGAPPGRKYTVNCVDFDGYDPERKVLLYAKLFRELRVTPKAWGLRGWDVPVLNEARRQVRAAAKAGGYPIEWHIALEEPARRAAELLAEYGGIHPGQIQVFHTPFESIQPPPDMEVRQA